MLMFLVAFTMTAAMRRPIVICSREAGQQGSLAHHEDNAPSIGNLRRWHHGCAWERTRTGTWERGMRFLRLHSFLVSTRLGF